DVPGTLRGEAKGGVKMDWSPPPVADASPAPQTPKVAQFRPSMGMFTASPSFAEMTRCQSTSPSRSRAPPPRVDSTARRSKSLAPSSSFNHAAPPPGSPMLALGAARSLTFGAADLKSTLTGLLRPSALSFGVGGLDSMAGSVAISAGIGRPGRAPGPPPLADMGESAQPPPPPPPPPPARSPAVGSRSCAPEALQSPTRGIRGPPPAVQQTRPSAAAGCADIMTTPQRSKAQPTEQHSWEEGPGQPAVQGFGWSPPGLGSGLSSARGRQPCPPHAVASPPQHKVHPGGRAG
ncbi:unnamed protein product, partial [Prorocentrum cordatum]